MANALSLGSMTYAIDFVHRMRHVIGHRGLIGNPLRIGLRIGQNWDKNRGQSEQSRKKEFPLHHFSQNLR